MKYKTETYDDAIYAIAQGALQQEKAQREHEEKMKEYITSPSAYTRHIKQFNSIIVDYLIELRDNPDEYTEIPLPMCPKCNNINLNLDEGFCQICHWREDSDE